VVICGRSATSCFDASSVAACMRTADPTSQICLIHNGSVSGCSNEDNQLHRQFLGALKVVAVYAEAAGAAGRLSWKGRC
jgi:hypothetical protein